MLAISITKIPDNIRQDAFKYVMENKPRELFELIAMNPGLINERSQGNQDTLFMRACRYLHKDIIEILLNEGASTTDVNTHGNNVIMCLFYREDQHKKPEDINEHDKKAVAILELFKETNISINCFTGQDADKDTPLIEAAKAALPQSVSFMLDYLEEKSLLRDQLLHTNKDKKNVLQIALKAKFFNHELIQKTLVLLKPEEIIKIFIDVITKINSPTLEEKKEFLSVVEEYLPKLDTKQVKSLAKKIFQKNLYNVSCGSDSTFHQENLQLEYEARSVVDTKELALKRFCFLIANNDKIEISQKSEAGILLDFVNIANNFKEYHYDIYDNFEKYLLAECKTPEKLKKVLNNYGNKITKFIKFEPNLVNKLNNIISAFEEDTDILTNEIKKLLNPDLINVLPRKVFLNFIDNKVEKEIDQKVQEFIQENLKFFTIPHKIEVHNYEKLNQEQFKSSIEHYKNNPESVIPYLPLILIADDERNISKLRKFLDNKYVKVKSTVDTCLNVIIEGQKYLKSLEAAEFDTSAIVQDLQNNLPILTDKIQKVLNDPEVEKVKNINTLCKDVNKFLNISPLTSLFEEYNNNY
ncbi:MAG TPA: ankyrin repeat domain-containing protein [Rickettsia endosymbiont of Columbicola hoogstraali]|nr:ankyrin repeat domain-containing protein [Rickettsia endosymbiont of Columbicola hoogstraali]